MGNGGISIGLGVRDTGWAKELKTEFCVQCRECEDKCPRHISIMDQLEEVAQVVGNEE